MLTKFKKEVFWTVQLCFVKDETRVDIPKKDVLDAIDKEIAFKKKELKKTQNELKWMKKTYKAQGGKCVYKK